MDEKNVLVDANLIVYLIGGHANAADLLANRALYFPFITEIEFLSFKKLSNREERTTHQILGEGIIFQSDSAITSLATGIRLNYGLEVPDAIIAATSIRYNLPLVSVDSDLSNKGATVDTIFSLISIFRINLS
ncbi:MAG: PIN domain-containing protein [Cyclobacteriaceae bacterium]|nr:PIN domain-containing protein [Cyclobacteriaceae bacterium]